MKSERKKKIICGFLSAFLLLESFQPVSHVWADGMASTEELPIGASADGSRVQLNPETVNGNGGVFTPETTVPTRDLPSTPASFESDTTETQPSASETDTTVTVRSSAVQTIPAAGEEEGLSAMEQEQVRAMASPSLALLRATRTVTTDEAKAGVSAHVLRLLVEDTLSQPEDVATIVQELTFYRRDDAARAEAVEAQQVAESADGTDVGSANATDATGTSLTDASRAFGILTGSTLSADDYSFDTTEYEKARLALNDQITAIEQAKAEVEAASAEVPAGDTQTFLDPAVKALAETDIDALAPVETFITLKEANDRELVVPVTLYPSVASRRADEGKAYALDATGTREAEAKSDDLTYMLTWNVDTLADADRLTLALQTKDLSSLRIERFTQSDGKTTVDLVAQAKQDDEAPQDLTQWDFAKEALDLTAFTKVGANYTLTLRASSDAQADAVLEATLVTEMRDGETVTEQKETVTETLPMLPVTTATEVTEAASETSADEATGETTVEMESGGDDSSDVDALAEEPEADPIENLASLRDFAFFSAMPRLASASTTDAYNMTTDPSATTTAEAGKYGVVRLDVQDFVYHLSREDETHIAYDTSSAIVGLIRVPKGAMAGDQFTVTLPPDFLIHHDLNNVLDPVGNIYLKGDHTAALIQVFYESDDTDPQLFNLNHKLRFYVTNKGQEFFNSVGQDTEIQFLVGQKNWQTLIDGVGWYYSQYGGAPAVGEAGAYSEAWTGLSIIPHYWTADNDSRTSLRKTFTFTSEYRGTQNTTTTLQDQATLLYGKNNYSHLSLGLSQRYFSSYDMPAMGQYMNSFPGYALNYWKDGQRYARFGFAVNGGYTGSSTTTWSFTNFAGTVSYFGQASDGDPLSASFRGALTTRTSPTQVGKKLSSITANYPYYVEVTGAVPNEYSSQLWSTKTTHSKGYVNTYSVDRDYTFQAEVEPPSNVVFAKVVREDRNGDGELEEYVVTHDSTTFQLQLQNSDGSYSDVSGGTYTVNAGSDGSFRISGLQPNKRYRLIETKVPTGFTQREAFTFSTNAVGIPVDDRGQSLVNDKGYIPVENTLQTPRNHLTIQKTDANGRALEGAQFAIVPINADGEPIAGPSFFRTSDANGKITLGAGELPAGRYMIREVQAPNGYQMTSVTQSFTVTESGIYLEETTSSTVRRSIPEIIAPDGEQDAFRLPEETGVYNATGFSSLMTAGETSETGADALFAEEMLSALRSRSVSEEVAAEPFARTKRAISTNDLPYEDSELTYQLAESYPSQTAGVSGTSFKTHSPMLTEAIQPVFRQVFYLNPDGLAPVTSGANTIFSLFGQRLSATGQPVTSEPSATLLSNSTVRVYRLKEGGTLPSEPAEFDPEQFTASLEEISYTPHWNAAQQSLSIDFGNAFNAPSTNGKYPTFVVVLDGRAENNSVRVWTGASILNTTGALAFPVVVAPNSGGAMSSYSNRGYGTINLEKYGDVGQLLGGATFELRPQDPAGSTEIFKVHQGENLGSATYVGSSYYLENGIRPGRYTIVETKAPESGNKAHYELEPNEALRSWELTVDDRDLDGRFEYVLHASNGKAMNEEDPRHIVITNTPQYDPLNLRIQLYQQNERDALTGGAFTLRPVGADASEAVPLKADGNLYTVEITAPGQYILEQTQIPDGYTNAERTWVFNVAANDFLGALEGYVNLPYNYLHTTTMAGGVVSVQTFNVLNKQQTSAATPVELPPPYGEVVTSEVSSPDLTMTFTNERNAGFRVQKIDEADEGKKLAGAVFQLTPEGGSEADAITVSTDGLGMAYFTHLDEGSYILREVEAPDGYQLNPKTATITVDAQGGVTWSGDLVNNVFAGSTETITSKAYVQPYHTQGLDQNPGANSYPYYMNSLSYVNVPDPVSGMLDFYLMLKPEDNPVFLGNMTGWTDKDTRVNFFGENVTIEDVTLYDVSQYDKATVRQLMQDFRGNEWTVGAIDPVQDAQLANYPFAFRQNVTDYGTSGGWVDVNRRQQVAYQIGIPWERFGGESADWSFLVKVRAKVQNVDQASSISYNWFTGFDQLSGDPGDLNTSGTFTLNPLRYDVQQTIAQNPKDPMLTVSNNLQNLGKLVIQKVSEETESAISSPLSGAEFTLTPQDGSSGIVAKSDRQGRVAFLNLEPGTYTLQETKPPAGYESSSETWTVIVGANGVVSLRVGNQALAQGTGTDEAPLVVSNVLKEVPVYKGEIHLKKVNEKDAPLSGVKFQLLYEDGKEVSDVIYETDNLGDIVINDVPAGRYFLKEIETKPGYELLQKPIPVMVGKNFEIPENVQPVDVSNQVRLEITNYGTDKGEKITTVYPNKTGLARVANHYTFLEKFHGGDYFYLQIDPNWDLKGLTEGNVGGFDLLGSSGVVATGVYEPETNRVKYTFTEYVDFFDVREATAVLSAFVNKYNVKYDTKLDFGEKIGSGTDSTQDWKKVTYTVNYEDVYYGGAGAPSMGSQIIRVNTDAKTFRQVIYLNPTFEWLGTMGLSIRPYLNVLGDSAAYFTQEDMKNLRIYAVRYSNQQESPFYDSFGWTDVGLATLPTLTGYGISMPYANQGDTTIEIDFGNFFRQTNWSDYDRNPDGVVVVVDGHYEQSSNQQDFSALQTNVEFFDQYSGAWVGVKNGVALYTNYGSAEGENTTVELTAQNFPSSIVFWKMGELTDRDGNVIGTTPLANASFELYKKDASGQWVTTGTRVRSEEDGKIELRHLPDGEYKLVEVQFPEGYDATQTVEKEFRVTGPKVEVKNEQGLYETLTTGETGNNRIINKRNPLGSFTLKKVDVQGKPMEGVTFRLRNDQGEILNWGDDDSFVGTSDGVELTTNAEGTVTFSNLPFGKYFLREIATKDGYTLDSTPRPILVGEKWEVPENVAGRDVSAYIQEKGHWTEEEQPDDSEMDVVTSATVVPLKDLVMDWEGGADKTTFHASAGQVLMTKIDYAFNTGKMETDDFTIQSGDTFTVTVSDNLDLRIRQSGRNEGFDLYNEQGRLAVAYINEDLKSITYTFTKLVDLYPPQDFTLNLPMGVDRSQFTGDVQNADFSVVIGEDEGKLPEGTPKNDFHFTKNVQFDPYGNYDSKNPSNRVESMMTRFDTSTGNFEWTIYVNPNHELLYMRGLLLRSPQAMSLLYLDTEVYKTTENLPPSFGIDFERGVDAEGRDLKLQKVDVVPTPAEGENNTWVLPLEELDTNAFVIRIKGTARDRYQPFRTNTHLYYTKPGEGTVQEASWQTENKFYNPYASFTSGGETPEFRNVVNQITFTKLEVPVLDENGRLPAVRKKLEGGLFELQKKQDDGSYVAVGEQVSADGNGSFAFDKLTEGVYQVIEVRAPLGYQRPSDPIVSTFEVDEQGNIVNVKNHNTDIFNTPMTYPLSGGWGSGFITLAGLALMALGWWQALRLDQERKGKREGVSES